MKFTWRCAGPADAPAVSVLVRAVFDEFVAADWEPQACAHFAAQSSADRLAQLLAEPAFAALTETGERVTGFILLPSPNLLAFLFVDGRSHRLGMARALWQAARTHLAMTHCAVQTVELNATPHAVAAYRALGFYPISEPFRRGGGLATRMACWLPGLALETPVAGSKP